MAKRIFRLAVRLSRWAILNRFKRDSRRQPRIRILQINRDEPRISEPRPVDVRHVVTVDSGTGQVIEEQPVEVALMAKQGYIVSSVLGDLPPNLPDDIIRLAARNAAFRQGIRAIQRLGLDNDLFMDAVYDLRRKYVGSSVDR